MADDLIAELGPDRTLLLVDDDADLLRLMSLRLAASGYRVTAVASAEAAPVRTPVR